MERRKLLACPFLGTPTATAGCGEDGLGSGTDPGQQNNPSAVTSVSFISSSATGKRRFPVRSAQATLVLAGSGEGWAAHRVVCPASVPGTWFRMGRITPRAESVQRVWAM